MAYPSYTAENNSAAPTVVARRPVISVFTGPSTGICARCPVGAAELSVTA